jgi:hypothetical protein
MVQFAPAASEVLQSVVPDHTRVKSAAFVPENVVARLVRAAVPVLVTVSISDALVVPTARAAKVSDVGETSATPTPPVPLRGTVTPVPGAATLMFSAALFTPSARGVNLTAMVQLAPAASEVLHSVVPE